MYANLPVPDASKTDPAAYSTEVAALTRLIRDQCPGPDGTRPTMQQLADLLGLSDTQLYAYIAAPKTGRRRPLAVPYPVVYALRAMAAYLPGTRRALWPSLPKPSGGPDGPG